jgi:hypothetical protein
MIEDDLNAVPEIDDPEIADELGDDEKVVPDKYAITSYGADYPVDGLVRRIRDGSIYVPSFQRGYVWPPRKACRFIESLLLGLPVPGIFFSRDQMTQKLLVIDGQQRLRTLQYFYDGQFPEAKRPFSLKGVQSQFQDVTYATLSDEDRRRLDDSTIHATIVKQDEPSEDQSSIYHIFERLNTGGELLKPQEIRACIYHGPFSDLLKELNANAHWRSIFGAVNRRMRDQELILRFLALNNDADNYFSPMKEFLNKFMGRNRVLAQNAKASFLTQFTDSIDAAVRHLGENVFKRERAFNAAIFDGTMVGLARRLDEGPVNDPGALRQRYEDLLNDPQFVAATEKATAREDQVSQRIQLAILAFDGCK